MNVLDSFVQAFVAGGGYPLTKMELAGLISAVLVVLFALVATVELGLELLRDRKEKP